MFAFHAVIAEERRWYPISISRLFCYFCVFRLRVAAAWAAAWSHSPFTSQTDNDHRQMWKSRYEQEKRRVEELERELMLAQRSATYTNGGSASPSAQEQSAPSLPDAPPSNSGSRSSSRDRGRGRSWGSNTSLGGSSGHVESPAEKMFAEQQLSFRVPPDDDDDHDGVRDSDVFMSHAVAGEVVGDVGICIDNIGAVKESVERHTTLPGEVQREEEDVLSMTSSVASKMKKGAKLITGPMKKAAKSAKKVLR